MKPVIFAVFAVIFYSSVSVVIEQKFSKYNTLTLMVCYLAIIWLISFFVRIHLNDNSATFAFPKGWDIFLVIVMSIILFAADFLYVGALQIRGNVFVVTSIMAMMPVCAIAIRYLFFERSVPNLYHILGFTAAFIAVLLITKGSLSEKSRTMIE